MLILTFLVKTIIDTYITLLLLRVLIQWERCDFYNSFSQIVFKITQPIIKPLLRILPMLGLVDTAAIILIFIFSMLKYPILLFTQIGVFYFNYINFFVGLLSLLKSIGYLIFWMIIIRVLMKWIQIEYGIKSVLIQLTDKLMLIIRSVIPSSIYGMDLSILIVLLLLYIINILGEILFPDLWYLL